MSACKACPVFLIALMGVFTTTSTLAQSVPKDVRKWVPVEAPADRESDAYKAFIEAAKDIPGDWRVSVDDGSVVVKDASKEEPGTTTAEDRPAFSLEAGDTFKTPATRAFLKVDDGWLIGFDAGDSGAALWWYSADGSSRYKISSQHIHQFIASPYGYFAVIGVSHMGFSKGSMIQLVRDEGRWTTRKFVALSQSGEAIGLLPDDSFVVVTTNTLVRITPARDLTMLVKDAGWASLAPNSVAVTPEGRIYVGMRAYVAAHELADAGGKLEFLVPKERVAETPAESGK